MRIDGDGPDGTTFSGEAKNLYHSTIEWLNSFEISEEGIRKRIDNLNISADWKQILHKATTITIKAGQTVVWIGRKILELVLLLVRTLPNTSFGLIFGAVVGSLVATIPIIGFVLGPLVSVILMAIWGIHGALEDIKNNLKGKAEETCEPFDPLQTA